MTTQFEKIYVISLISNKDRQEFVKYQMDELGLDFEFIYGIDFYNIKFDKCGNEISWPPIIPEWSHLDNSKSFGCALSHYNAVLHAYEFGYNNVLILEDDICFIKNKELICKYLNTIPENVDFMTYDTRFADLKEYEMFMNYQYQYLYINNDKNKNNDFIKIPNGFSTLCGGMMYGLMNRKTMELHLNNQRNKFLHSDHVEGLFENPTVNRYSSIHAICMDQYNRLRQGKKHDIYYGLVYEPLNIVYRYNDFYEPAEYNISNLNNKIEDAIIE